MKTVCPRHHVAYEVTTGCQDCNAGIDAELMLMRLIADKVAADVDAVWAQRADELAWDGEEEPLPECDVCNQVYCDCSECPECHEHWRWCDCDHLAGTGHSCPWCTEKKVVAAMAQQITDMEDARILAELEQLASAYDEEDPLSN